MPTCPICRQDRYPLYTVMDSQTAACCLCVPNFGQKKPVDIEASLGTVTHESYNIHPSISVPSLKPDVTFILSDCLKLEECNFCKTFKDQLENFHIFTCAEIHALLVHLSDEYRQSCETKGKNNTYRANASEIERISYGLNADQPNLMPLRDYITGTKMSQLRFIK